MKDLFLKISHSQMLCVTVSLLWFVFAMWFFFIVGHLLGISHGDWYVFPFFITATLLTVVPALIGAF